MIKLQRINIAEMQAPDEVMDDVGMSLMQPVVRVIPAFRKSDGQKVWVLGNPVPPEYRKNIEDEGETRVFAVFLTGDMVEEYDFPGGEDNG